ncbi:MAG: hypothetical protein MJ090_06130 [Clostridia bacterium]|nr:hypothetical protein [Clostridia bacterium]
MYPILLGFDEEYDGNKQGILSFIISNIGRSTVKNGEFIGSEIKDVLRKFGKECFGEKGINTAFFRSDGDKFALMNKLKTVNSRVDTEDATIYPFGVVNSIINDADIVADSLMLDGRAGLREEESFLILYVKENDCLLSDFDSTMKVSKNDCVFIPQKTRVQITGKAEIILIHM